MLNLGKLGKQLGNVFDELTGAAEKRRQAENADYEILYSVFADPILNQPTHDDAAVLRIKGHPDDEVPQIWQRLAMNVKEHVGNKRYPPSDSNKTSAENEASDTMVALTQLGTAIKISDSQKTDVILEAKHLERLVNNIGFLRETRDEMADILGIQPLYRTSDQNASAQNSTVVSLAAFQKKAEQGETHERVKEMAGETVLALDLLLPVIEENLSPLLYARKPHLDPGNGPLKPEDFVKQSNE